MLNGKLSGRSQLSATLNGKSSIVGRMSLPAERAGDYERLKNLPQINNVTVIGNKSFDEYGLGECTNLDIDSLFKNIF